MLSPARWKKLEEVYHAAWPLQPGERHALLHRVCAGDEELRREAEGLLAADGEAADDFLQSGAFTPGMQLLADQETRRSKMALLPVGMKLDGRYEIIEKLAEGGMGEVYKARALRLDSLVVIKVLKEESLKNPWIVTKFKQEAIALARIDDKGVVRIFNAGALENGSPYLVMQYVEGADLRQHIKAAGNGMELAKVAAIMKQVGQGVAAIHGAGLVHRDLKPDNLMIQDKADNNEPVVKVIDLGIVRVLDTGTVMGQFVGTLYYMSPEQLKGQDVTPASDVYALGVIAHEMLTGRLPFRPIAQELPAAVKEISEMQQAGVQIKPRQLRPDLPEAAEQVLLQVLLKALTYDANKRQQSARAFGDALAQALTPQPPPRPTPTLMDKRWLAAAAAVGVLAVCLMSALWWNFASPTPAREQVIDNLIANSPTAAAPGPANGPVYDAEAAFPTGQPPQGMVYATIGFTVWRTRNAR